MARLSKSTARIFQREAPWMVAAVVACTAVFSAIPPLNHPWGSNWPMYFEAAHYFWDPTAAYFGWRPPLYPLLLATLGEPLGYVAAAHWIAKGSMVVVIAASAVVGRLMVGSGAAVIAVLTIPLLQCAVEGAMWTNMYPPAAAAFALATAAGSLAYRRPSIAGALVTGVLAGVAWRINHLGLVAIPMGLGLCALGAFGRSHRLLWLLIPLTFGVGTGAAVAVDNWVVSHWNVPQEGLGDQVLQRRREELDRIASGQADPARFGSCTDLTPKPLNIAELTNACGRQFIAANYGTLRAEDCAPNPSTLLWLLPFALLPGVRQPSWRDTAASVVVFGGPMGAFLVAAAWTSYAEKYAITFLPVMVLLVPMALYRAGGWLGRWLGHAGIGGGLGLVGAGAWVALQWPGASGPWADRPNIKTDWESVAGTVADWASSEMGEGDLLIDCVPLNIDLVVLPERFETLEGVSADDACTAWVESPPTAAGTVWLVQQSFPELPKTQPRHLQQSGWRLVKQYDDRHRLWERAP